MECQAHPALPGVHRGCRSARKTPQWGVFSGERAAAPGLGMLPQQACIRAIGPRMHCLRSIVTTFLGMKTNGVLWASLQPNGTGCDRLRRFGTVWYLDGTLRRCYHVSCQERPMGISNALVLFFSRRRVLCFCSGSFSQADPSILHLAEKLSPPVAKSRETP